MSVQKIESIEIKYIEIITQPNQVRVTLSKEEKEELDKIKEQMNSNIQEYEQHERENLSGIYLSGIYLSGIYSSGIYGSRKKAVEALTAALEPLVLRYTKRLEAEIVFTYPNSWYIVGEKRFKEVENFIKGEKFYYILPDNVNVYENYKKEFDITIKSCFPDIKSYYLESFILKGGYIFSPLDEYLNKYKRGEDVEILNIHSGSMSTKTYKRYLLYGNNVYKANRAYSDEELKLLMAECEDNDRRKFERLKNKFALAQDEVKNRRERIPEQVRIAVWRRDEGKCVVCGSNEKLEYDHIIPVSKGGSNTERNIQLLCENCNRKKSANIE